MKKEELLNIIYSYYPRGVSREYREKYDNSKEWTARADLSLDFFIGNIQRWEDFKKELSDFLCEDERSVADYSSFCHYIQIVSYNGEPFKNTAVLDIFISYVAPYWAYELQDPEHKLYDVVPDGFTMEKEIINGIGLLIQKYFKEYELLPDEWRKTIIPDIEIPGKKMPDVTFYDALFRG